MKHGALPSMLLSCLSCWERWPKQKKPHHKGKASPVPPYSDATIRTAKKGKTRSEYLS
jgi:hypothetical protein